MGKDINLTPSPFPKGKGSLAELKAQALEDALDKLKAAVEAALNPSPLPSPAVAGEGALRYWVFRTYPDFVVARRGDKFFKVEYSLDDAGELTIEKPVAVEKLESWIPAEMKALAEYDPPQSPRPGERAEGRNTGEGEEDDLLVFFGGEAKALADGKVGGYLVRFSTAKDPDISEERDFFTPETNFGEHMTTEIFYHHGLDRKIGKKSIGKGTLTIDDVGVWVDAQLKMRDAYEKAIYKLAKAGKLGWSSATVPSLVTRVSEGKAHRITQWLLGIDASLLTIPAEPRNAAVAMKSLSFAEDELEALEEGQETLDGAASPKQPTPNPSLTPATKGQLREQAGGEIRQGVEEMDPKEIAQMIADGIAASKKAEEDASAAKAAQQAEIDKAVKAREDELKAEWAKGNRLPMGGGAPYVKQFGDTDRFDNYAPEELALTIEVLKAAREPVSQSAIKALAFKYLELKDDKERLYVHGEMKAAGLLPTEDAIKAATDPMYTTGSNIGADWIGTSFSHQIWEKVRAIQSLVGLIPEDIIPDGYGSKTWPLEYADPTWYNIPETSAADATMKFPAASIPASQMGTAKKEITVGKPAARVMYSGELTEDSLLPFAAQLQSQLVVTSGETLEHLIIDGDTTTTGSTNINDIGNSSTQTATNLHLAFSGMRKLALVTNTANSRSASGLLSVDDFIETIWMMGTAGMAAARPDKCRFIIDPNVQKAASKLPEVLTKDVNSVATLENGWLTRIWNILVVTSWFMHMTSATRKANTAGKVDQTTVANNTTGSILGTRIDQWKLAHKRRLKIEFTRFANSDSNEIVASMRAGLGYRDTEASAITYNVGV